MTKADLIELLEGFPDDTFIRIPSMDSPGYFPLANYVEVYDYGSDGSSPEVIIV